MAALGILGGLAAPLLAGAEPDGGTAAILFMALASAAGVLLWQRWDWLALAAFMLAAPQWVAYLFDGAGPLSALATLVSFGALGVAVAVGHDLRMRARGMNLTSAFLLGLNAIVVAGAGWASFEYLGRIEAAKVWLVAMAVAHLVVGLLAPRLARMSHELGLLSLVIGVVLGDVAFGLLRDGLALAVGWTVTGVAFAVLVRWVQPGRERPGAPHHLVFTGAGLGGHLCLALVSALTLADPLEVLGGDASLSAVGAGAVAVLAAGCLVSARLVESADPRWRLALDGAGLAAIALLTALTLDGTALVVAWLAEVGVLILTARRSRDRLAGWGALGFFALAVGKAIADAPFELLVSGSAPELGVLVELAGVTAGAMALAHLLPRVILPERTEPLRMVLEITGLAGLTLLSALALDGAPLVAALAGEAVVLAVVSRRVGDTAAGWAAPVFLGMAVLHALALEAPPVALVEGLTEPAAALAACCSIAAAALIVAEQLELLHPRAHVLLRGVAATALLYLGSTLVVTPFESGEAMDSALLSAHQQGQMVLSIFWGLVGLGTVVVGLRRDLAPLRLAGLALLGLTVGKVFLFDLATLTSVYRVVSFIGLGLLLLVGAFVWQKLRPQELPDLREAPRGLR